MDGDSRLPYGTVEDAGGQYNYYVECFVVSDIADKGLVRKLWNISADEAGPLTLTETRAVKKVSYGLNDSGDLRKGHFAETMRFETIMRITVKPGFTNIGFSSMKKEAVA